MKCEISTCRNHRPRKDAKTTPEMCVGHAILFAITKETRAEFVARQEAQDRARKGAA